MTVRPSGEITVSLVSPSAPPLISNTTSASLSVAFCSRRTLATVKGTGEGDSLSAPSARPYHPERRRSEEHTSELQSHSDLVCRLLLEKKKPTSTLSWPPAPP